MIANMIGSAAERRLLQAQNNPRLILGYSRFPLSTHALFFSLQSCGSDWQPFLCLYVSSPSSPPFQNMAPDKESYQYDSLESALVDEGYEIGLLPDFRLISEAEDSKEQRTNRKSFLTRVALASSCLINIFLLWRTCFAPFEAIPSNISRSPYGMSKTHTPYKCCHLQCL
jgi:hypothetical protein